MNGAPVFRLARQPMAMEYRTRSTSGSAKKIKLFTGPGTRQWPRFDISEIPSIKGISLKSGTRTRVVNLSRGGALLQTSRRIARGTGIGLSFNVSEGAIQLTGLVLRSPVSSLKRIPQYHAAIAFDRPFEIFDESTEPKEDYFAVPSSQSLPRGLFPADIGDRSQEPSPDEDSAMIEAFLAVSFCHAPDAAPDEMSGLNDW